MKKSFSLFLTILIIGTFSFVSIKYFELKSFKTNNIKNQIVYIQAKNHMNFLKKISKTYDFNEKLEVQNSEFLIYALKKDSNIHYFVKSKKESINLYEKDEI